MYTKRWIVLSALSVAVSGCAAQSVPIPSTKSSGYRGPKVTRVVVMKDRRRLYLLNGKNVLRQYNIGLGFAPEGDKKVRGDGKTPEGHYIINRRNPNSRYYLSLGISYPNARDIAEARALGRDPGGDIFIHGRPKEYSDGGRDWTWGCIAVTDRHMREIYAMVETGTPISIYR
ncbi:murein L,D-transpeptidase family protein [Aestuariicoccus sp. MJ-SS9]|uniref:L,D-transpeptidase family protein n=1 Tax=Aestuariicoccus sp. MJ-SS9 TaxID=3079855 RepID=UPI00290D51D6|nr:L,D-transpeptidase family protein [Aestuariicoccus sp. MJ-SS9]MDU8910877.1 L,D-transpeptidase family protein [Aestuariicoccus sp. MJ-SS9]